MYIRVMGMTTIKIKDETLERIKIHIESSGQTIASFVDIAVSHELHRVAQERKILKSYGEKMTPMLGDAINGTRKTKRK